MNVLVTGGYNDLSFLNSTELYNPFTETWALGDSMNIKRAYHTASVLNNGNVLVTGGYNGSIAVNSAELY
jgi:hypothetical protein